MTASHRASWCVRAAIVIVLGWSGFAIAQGQDASIIGQVTDESGAVLPGVTVTTTSPALQRGDLVAVTNERGEYRLTPLPIGTYDVVYALPGFQTVRQEGVRLTVGFVAKIDIRLKLGGLEESITVSGASPVVDVTSTGTSTQLTRETLELIPSTRNGLLSLMAQAPGVRGNLDIGGNNFSAIPTFRAYGQDGEQWSTIEGVMTSGPVGGFGSGNYWDYSAFEETRVGTVGKGIEIPVRGVQIQAIVKSGGNAFHGGAFFTNTNHRFQGTNLTPELEASGLSGGNTIEKQWDLSGDLGGRLIKDKLWFYVAERKRVFEEALPGVFQPDGSQGIHGQEQQFHTVKSSYQMTPGNRLVGFYTYALKEETAQDTNVFNPWEHRRNGHIPTATTKGEWQGVKGNLVASAQYGRWYYNADYASFSDEPSRIDLITLYTAGGNPNNRNALRNKRQHTMASVSWYKPDFFKGNHELKAGFDYMAESGGNPNKVRSAGDYELVFRSLAPLPSFTTPFQLRTFNTPTNPQNTGRYLGTYLSDNWTISRRLTINVGVRYARDASFAPPGCKDAGTFSPQQCIDEIRFKTWHSVAPRVSVALDLTGDARTVLKGGWGRYDSHRKLDRVQAANPIANTTTTWTWRDLNNDRLYQPGEVNLDPNGGDYVSQTGASNAIPDPDEVQPKEDQTFVGLERELIPNLAVRLTGVYSRLFNVERTVNLRRPYEVYDIPITNLDPGPDGRLGTADDTGRSFTYYDYPAAYAGAANQLNMLTFVPGTPAQTFKTIEVAATKRLSDGWQLSASYSATKLHTPIGENEPYTPNNTLGFATYTAANVIIPYPNDTWEWVARFSGVYVFPQRITLSANMENRSGTRGARNVLFSGGRQIPTFAMAVEPVGSLNLPPIRSLDVRVEKAFMLPRGQKLTGRLNVYNTLNANTVTAQTTRSGASFLRPTAIMPPRLFELSASYAF